MSYYNEEDMFDEAYCHSKIYDKYADTYAPGCPFEWDGTMCWRRTPVGQHSDQQCMNLSEQVYRFCNYDGTWDQCPLEAPPIVYEHEKDTFMRTMDMLIPILDISSLVFLSIALLTWVIVWIKRKHTSSPYRYASFVVILSASLLIPTLRVIYSFTNPDINGLRSSVSQCFLREIIPNISVSLVSCALLMYLFFCLLVANERELSGIRILLGVIVSLGISLLLGTIYGIVLLVKYGDSCLVASWSSNISFIMRAPNLLVQVLTLILDIIIILFSFNTTRFKSTRDYRLIRHSSFCVLAIIVLEISIDVMGALHLVSGYHQVTFSILLILFATRGIFFSILLCFVDLEILSLWPCACVKLGSIEFPPLVYNEMTQEKEKQKSSIEMGTGPRLTTQDKPPQYGTIIGK